MKIYRENDFKRTLVNELRDLYVAYTDSAHYALNHKVYEQLKAPFYNTLIKTYAYYKNYLNLKISDLSNDTGIEEPRLRAYLQAVYSRSLHNNLMEQESNLWKNARAIKSLSPAGLRKLLANKNGRHLFQMTCKNLEDSHHPVMTVSGIADILDISRSTYYNNL
jgi:hypothetical protein